MYAGLEHEGHINSGSLHQTKPPGRPPKMNMPKRRALPPSVGPGPGIEQTGHAVPLAKAPKQSSDSSPEELALQNILQAAHLGHYFRSFLQQGVSTGMQAELTFADLRSAFGLTLKQVYDLRAAAANVPALENLPTCSVSSQIH